MPSATVTFAAGANVAGSGEDWVNPGNAAGAANGVYATSALVTAVSSGTDQLELSNGGAGAMENGAGGLTASIETSAIISSPIGGPAGVFTFQFYDNAGVALGSPSQSASFNDTLGLTFTVSFNTASLGSPALFRTVYNANNLRLRISFFMQSGTSGTIGLDSAIVTLTWLPGGNRKVKFLRRGAA